MFNVAQLVMPKPSLDSRIDPAWLTIRGREAIKESSMLHYFLKVRKKFILGPKRKMDVARIES